MPYPMSLQLFAEEAAPAEGPEETGRKAALYDAFAPSLETLAKRYGIEADPAALENALHQEEAARRDYQQRQAGKLCDAWMDQAEQTRQAYPGFDLTKELRDPRFLGLLRSRVDVCTAYEALHRQEARDRMEQSLLEKIARTGLRPQENAASSQSPVVTRQDVSRMSRQERQSIIRRVQQGEKISF